MTYSWGEGGKGAAGGALTGAAYGSMLAPGIGTAVGGAIGGGLGLLAGFGSKNTGAEDEQRRMLMDYYAQVGGRAAPTVGPAGQAGYSDFRSNQSGLISRLEAMANGTGPSLARQQFEQATDRNMRGQQAMAASGRGGPLAQLTAANNMAQLGANAAQGSALARTNEQMGAISQLGGVIGQGRAADEAINQFNVGQGNQFQLANLDARLRTMGMNDQVRMGILGQLGGLNQAQATRPSFGDQMLAGGAGAFSMAATQRAQMGLGQRGGGASGYMSQSAPVGFAKPAGSTSLLSGQYPTWG